MPIRMEKDDPAKQPRRDGNNGNQLARWLPLLLLFVFKRPRLLIPLLIIGGIWYFFWGGSQLLSGGLPENDLSEYALGAALSEERYDRAEVFEPLAYGSNLGDPLPRRSSLESYAPRPQHQGQQGSCVGWASAYAARTILEARTSGKAPDQIAFSPAYLYNQIALRGCQGAYMLDAMQAMQQNGSLPYRQFPYNQNSCTDRPEANQLQLGQQFRIKGFNRLTLGGNNYQPDLIGIKQHLAQGSPVVIGMQVGGTFMSRMVGQSVWRPTRSDYSLGGFSGHAMCVVGYDDDKEGGAFRIMNSWSTDWGEKGFTWVRYPDFEYFVKEAYGIYPMGASEKFDENRMAVEFGLYDLKKRGTIALAKTGDLTFRTARPIAKGDKFKVVFANSIECYTYVFGQETDGSSYVLFPYTEKHSPYCGITGTRLFPKDYSMVADDTGNKDFIAIVVSKTPLDYRQLNERISAGSGSYAGRLQAALAAVRTTDVRFEAGPTISFTADTREKNVVGMVIEIDKR